MFLNIWSFFNFYLQKNLQPFANELVAMREMNAHLAQMYAELLDVKQTDH